jgi:DNA (cytosine-5)-methyltransferase 1
MDFESETFVTHPVAFKASHFTRGKDGAPDEVAPPLSADADKGDQDTLLCAPKVYQDSEFGVGEYDTAGSIRAGIIPEHQMVLQQAIPILEPGSRTGKSTTDPRAGMGVGEPGDPMYTLQGGRQHGVAVQTSEPVAFDTTQVTSKANRSNPKPGDPRHPLAAGAPVIAFQCQGTNVSADDDVSGTMRQGNQHVTGGACVAFSCKDHGADAGDIVPTLRAMPHDKSHANAGGQAAVAFNLRGRDGGAQPEYTDIASLRSASGGSSRSYVAQMAVRRLTSVECARLQGFSDTYCHIPRSTRKIDPDEAEYLIGHGLECWQEDGQWFTKVAADGPIYRAYGNSIATPVLRWIGERIEAAERNK